MKKFVAFALSGFILVGTAALSACNSNKAFAIPDDCYLVTTDIDITLKATEDDTVCKFIETKIKGIEKDDHYNYFCVSKDSTVEISSYKWCQTIWGKTITQKFLKGYDIDGTFVEFNKQYCAVVDSFTVNDNCTITGVYEGYSTVGIIIDTVSNLTNLDYYEAQRYFDAEGNVIISDNIYYLLYSGENFDKEDGWQTNLNVKNFGSIYNPYSYSAFDNKGTYQVFEGYDTAITVEKIQSDGVVRMDIGKTESGRYFVEYVNDWYTNSDSGYDTAEYGKYFSDIIGNNFLYLYFVI
ncbi:MAG: hypothetical protein K2O62_00555 [Clostridia bacterium]|nr:hypothetical protein [Clostridia bacterium]